MQDCQPTEAALLPRLLTREQAAAYCNLSLSSFSQWIRLGRLPGPLVGTARWDIRAIDVFLDKASGVVPKEAAANALDQWLGKKNAHSSQGNP